MRSKNEVALAVELSIYYLLIKIIKLVFRYFVSIVYLSKLFINYELLYVYIYVCIFLSPHIAIVMHETQMAVPQHIIGHTHRIK